jgi:hypothetical protein
VLTPAKGTAPGYLLVAEQHGPGQFGPMILDDRGQLVLFQPIESRTPRRSSRIAFGSKPGPRT